MRRAILQNAPGQSQVVGARMGHA